MQCSTVQYITVQCSAVQYSTVQYMTVNVPFTSVPGCDCSNAKTFVLQHLQFLDMGACDGPPNGTSIDHHGKDELLIQQNTIPD